MSHGRIQDKKNAGRFRVISGQDSVPAELAREAARSPKALEQLCDHYVPKIYNFILKRVANTQDAEDLTSVVFEKVIVNLEAFDESRASFTTWIYRIATNSVTDFYRSRGRKRELSLDDESGTEIVLVSDGLDNADLYMALVDLMKQLAPKYQEALALRYFAGLRVQEVAETLQITESAASKRVLRGLEEMKRLAEGGPLDELLQGT